MKKFEDMKNELAALNGYAFWEDLIKGRTDKQISDLLERAGRMLDEYYTGEAVRQFGERRETPTRIIKNNRELWNPMHTPPPPVTFVVCIDEVKKLVGVDRKGDRTQHFKAEWTHWVPLPVESTGWDYILPESIEKVKLSYRHRPQWQRDEEQRLKEQQQEL
jgi:hypothetical protein